MSHPLVRRHSKVWPVEAALYRAKALPAHQCTGRITMESLSTVLCCGE